VCDLETSRMGAPYIYDISRLRVNEFIYPARARTSVLGLSIPREDDELLIWLLSGSYDNIERKSKFCCSNLELSKRVPSSNPSCCLQ